MMVFKFGKYQGQSLDTVLHENPHYCYQIYIHTEPQYKGSFYKALEQGLRSLDIKMPFGKYKGVSVSKLDKGYCEFLMNKVFKQDEDSLLKHKVTYQLLGDLMTDEELQQPSKLL